MSSSFHDRLDTLTSLVGIDAGDTINETRREAFSSCQPHAMISFPVFSLFREMDETMMVDGGDYSLMDDDETRWTTMKSDMRDEMDS